MIGYRALGALGFGLVLVAGCSSQSADDGAETEGQLAGHECSAGGLYCGGDTVKGDRSILYRCDVKPGDVHGARQANQVERCAGGCLVRPGQNDACKATHSTAEASELVKRFYGAHGPQNALDPAVLTPELLRELKNPALVPGSSAAFVCGQDELLDVKVAAATRDGENALVGINDGAITVTVRLSDLRIAGWVCGKPRHGADDAHVAVREFYGNDGPNDWRHSNLFDAATKQALERYSDPAIGGSNADPVICAQDYPFAISVDPAVQMGEFAVMTVRESFGPGATNDVTAYFDMDRMKFATIVCPEDTTGGPWAFNPKK
jgi:hypothetical protein